jgi:LVIVD repeat
VNIYKGFLAGMLMLGIAACEQQQAAHSDTPDQILYVWMFDDGLESPNFLAVINAEAASPGYGTLIDTVPVSEAKGWAHHTSVVLPESGYLFANDFPGNYTYVYDMSNLAQPRLVNEFGAIGEYTFAHSFSELPNGNILATYQSKGEGNLVPGGLVEFTPTGEVVRTADAAIEDDRIFLRPYGIVLVPGLDRIVTTSYDMRGGGIGHHVQVWSLSGLELLDTVAVPEIEGAVFGDNPFEARLLADRETVMVETLSCGLYVLSDIAGDEPKVEYVYSFEGGNYCSLPVRLGQYWIQTVQNGSAGGFNGMIVLDVSNPSHPVEVDRITMTGAFGPHWSSADRSGRKIVINGYGAELSRRVMMLDFDPETGHISIDQDFGEGDAAGPGFIVDRESWPHGDTGKAIAHGAVFWPPAPPDWKAN